MTQPTSPARPTIVNIAFWLVLVGAVLLLAGGLLGLSVAFSAEDAVFGKNTSADAVQTLRILLGGLSVLWALVGMALSFLAGRARNGDLRFRRVVVWMAVAVVVMVFLLTLLAPFTITLPVLFGVVPLAIGATLFMRPAASDWFLEMQ
ncbi:hypothetical protein [Mycobacterium sp. C31M]